MSLVESDWFRIGVGKSGLGQSFHLHLHVWSLKLNSVIRTVVMALGQYHGTPVSLLAGFVARQSLLEWTGDAGGDSACDCSCSCPSPQAFDVERWRTVLEEFGRGCTSPASSPTGSPTPLRTTEAGSQQPCPPTTNITCEFPHIDLPSMQSNPILTSVVGSTTSMAGVGFGWCLRGIIGTARRVLDGGRPPHLRAIRGGGVVA